MRCNLAWIDKAGHYVQVTDEFAQLCGRPMNELVGAPITSIHSELASAAITALRAKQATSAAVEATLALFDSHTLYHCRLITQQDGLTLLVAERARQQPVIDHNAYNSDESTENQLFKAALNTQIAAAVKASKHVALLKLELERFQWVEESLGEDASKRVIEEVVRRLLRELRESDTLFRVRTDAFIVQLSLMESAEAAVRVAHRLIDQLGYSIQCDNRELHLGASVGVALAPLQAHDAAELLGAASQALKALHRSGNSGVRLYDPTRQRKALNLSDLAQLIKPDYQSISIEYRPIYGVYSHRVEAAQLVPVIKGVACVGEDEQLLTQTLEGDSGWHTYLSWIFNQLEGSLVRLAQQKNFHGVVVRIPRDVLELPSFMTFMTTRLNLSHQAKQMVLLEVDAIETQDHEGVLFDLEALGFRIVLSGLGEHLPTLQQLKELEPHLMKLDHALVQDMADTKRRLLLEKIADISADLEIPLAAEGVESAGQRMQLAHQGVAFMQGSYFGRLLSIELLFEQLVLEKI